MFIELSQEQLSQAVRDTIDSLLASGEEFTSHAVKESLREKNANFCFKGWDVYVATYQYLAPMVGDGSVERFVREYNMRPVYVYRAVDKEPVFQFQTHSIFATTTSF